MHILIRQNKDLIRQNKLHLFIFPLAHPRHGSLLSYVCICWVFFSDFKPYNYAQRCGLCSIKDDVYLFFTIHFFTQGKLYTRRR